MIAFRLAMSEIRRVTAGVLPKLAVLALILVPVLYSATYLYANWDPNGNLGGVKAAIVNEDQAVQSDGKTIDSGTEITKNLQDSGTFDFTAVSAKKADAGIKDGTYAFTITIPAGFSANLTSAADFDPQQAVLKVTTNDANNYLVGTIADRVSASVRQSVSKQVGEQAANKFLIGFSDVHGKLLQASDGAGQIADGTAKLKDGAVQLKDGTAQAESGSSQLVAGQQKLVDGAVALDSGASQLADGTAKLADGTATLSDGATTLASGLGILKEKTATLPSQTAKLADGAQQVADGNATIADVSGKVAGAAQQAIDGAPAARAQLQQQLLAAGIPQDQVDQALAQIDALFVPVQQANAQLQDANGQVQKLADGAQQVATGAQQLADAGPALADGIAQASSGAQQVASGAQQVDSGAQQASAGSQKLADGTGALVDGQQQALVGAQQLADGIAKLDDGAGQLGSGLGELLGGSTQLRDQLAQGAQSVPHPDDATREATADQIADPMAIQQSSIASAGNYGSGLAPFFLGLSLWVGAFTLFLLIKPLSTRALAGRAPVFQTALGGWLPAAALGLIQAVAVYGVGVGLVGLEPVHPWLTLGILMLTSLAFTSILHGLNARFGAIGKFLGLVLLILQLVSAGGTFPWETTPGPLHALHHVLPLGYVVDALRHAMYGGPQGPDLPDLIVLVIYLCVGLALSTWSAATDRSWNLKRLKPELEL